MIVTPERIRLAGCPVQVCSLEGAAAELCDRIRTHTKTHVVFVNAAKVVQYQKDPALREVIERADMLLADGMPLVWLSRMKGTPLPCRIAGVDLMELMVAAAAERGYRVFFLGAKREVVSKVVAHFQWKYPQLKLAGFSDGYFKACEEERIVTKIKKSNADLVLIAMSTPQKEFWADRNLERLGTMVCQGVGGGFDVITGVTKRAPRWMQRSGLEWSYRLLQEPRRMWKRYLFSNLSFIRLALLDLFNGYGEIEAHSIPASSSD
jgi:N-acetylglucosaminyldiphosphoundecaprenol N-acetyl-beta-D-mannosaminyltransferase